MRHIYFLFVLLLVACNSKDTTPEKANYGIIPAPVDLKEGDGWIQFNNYTDMLDNVSHSIVDNLGPEAYVLSISDDGIKMTAGSSLALKHANTSLRQLTDLNNSNSKVKKLNLPFVDIADAPIFTYRGMHLDVARHMFSIETIKEYIDMLAYYKMNTFHWHLTEDQGWRIEIKKYPKLQEIAAYRPETLIGHYNDNPQTYDGKRYGGFYTQEEVKEVVAYATSKGVDVIPEIEMPGHAQASIAAYPELGCTGEQLEPMTKWGVSDNVYCPTEETFTFLENVLDEVIPLFPSKYIHIGGDEAPKTQWKNSAFCQQLIKEKGLKDEHGLQSYFIQRMEKYINSKGKQIIGWDEILEGGLAPNATVMSWRGEQGGIEAAKQGHDVIMTPTGYCYFDYYQSDNAAEPLAIGGYLPLKKVYSYNPIPEELTAEEAKHILGTQGNVWTEYIPTKEKLEYMAYPRMAALAEVAWTANDKKDYTNFVKRLHYHLQHFKAKGVNVAEHIYDVDSKIVSGTGEGIKVEFTTPLEDANVSYNWDGERDYEDPISITKSGKIIAQTYLNGEKVGRPASYTFDMHKAAGQSISIEENPHARYSAGGKGAIINGVLGSNERYGDTEWLGFSGKDINAIIDLGEVQKVSESKFRFFNGPGQWIYLPKEVNVYTSSNGKDYELAGKAWPEKNAQEKVIDVAVLFDEVDAQYIKVEVKRFGLIPEDAQGGGNEAWLFIDEIVVN